MSMRVAKRKMDWADKIATSDKGSYYTQQEVVLGNCVVVIFVALFISADHVDQKAICIVSYPVYYHSYPAGRLSASITALGSFCFTGISGSLVIPSHAHSALPLIFVLVTFFPFSVSLGISNIVLAYS